MKKKKLSLGEITGRQLDEKGMGRVYGGASCDCYCYGGGSAMSSSLSRADGGTVVTPIQTDGPECGVFTQGTTCMLPPTQTCGGNGMCTTLHGTAYCEITQQGAICNLHPVNWQC